MDRYELLGLIGQGSFGTVHRARHVHTGQMHALKLARGSIDPDAAARVLAEARAAAGLRHPNIVAVTDGGTNDQGESFVVMELLEGMTIAQVVTQSGPLPLERAANIARQMLDGLAAAHAAGIVHRDIKPSNVFVVAGDRVKIIDFGISKIRPENAPGGPLTLPGVALGTPGYMAPEQLGDARSVDARADVYAASATLYEMLTGRKPIEADTFETWMKKLRAEPATPVAAVEPRLPPAVCAVIDRGLARDPDARWPSALAMRQALDQALPSSVAPTVVDTPRVVVQVASHPPPPQMHAPQYQPPAPLPSHAAPPRPASPPAATPASVLPWVITGLAGLVALVGIGLFAAVLYVTRTSDEPTVAASAPRAASPTAEPSEPESEPDPEPGTAPTSTPTSTSTATTPKPAVRGRAQISPPRIVGELRQDAFMALAERARPAIERCNASKKRVTVRIDMHVTFDKIGLVRESAAEDPGDPKIARCCAQAMKDAQWPGFRPGETGIYSAAEITWE